MLMSLKLRSITVINPFRVLALINYPPYIVWDRYIVCCFFKIHLCHFFVRLRFLGSRAATIGMKFCTVVHPCVGCVILQFECNICRGLQM